MVKEAITSFSHWCMLGQISGIRHNDIRGGGLLSISHAPFDVLEIFRMSGMALSNPIAV